MKNINPQMNDIAITSVHIEDALTGDTFITMNWDEQPTTIGLVRSNELPSWIDAHPRADVVVHYMHGRTLMVYEIIEAQ